MIEASEAAQASDGDALGGAVEAILAGAYDGAPPPAMRAALATLAGSMSADGARREDPMREIFARLGDKWSMLLLLLLRAGPARHSVLKKLVNALGADDAISQRVLTLRLRSLERDGLVSRTITPTVPPRVDYALTPLGEGLLVQVDGLMGWVRAHTQAIRTAQTLFAQEEAT